MAYNFRIPISYVQSGSWMRVSGNIKPFWVDIPPHRCLRIKAECVTRFTHACMFELLLKIAGTLNYRLCYITEF